MTGGWWTHGNKPFISAWLGSLDCEGPGPSEGIHGTCTTVTLYKAVYVGVKIEEWARQGIMRFSVRQNRTGLLGK